MLIEQEHKVNEEKVPRPSGENLGWENQPSRLGKRCA